MQGCSKTRKLFLDTDSIKPFYLTSLRANRWLLVKKKFRKLKNYRITFFCSCCCCSTENVAWNVNLRIEVECRKKSKADSEVSKLAFLKTSRVRVELNFLDPNLHCHCNMADLKRLRTNCETRNASRSQFRCRPRDWCSNPRLPLALWGQRAMLKSRLFLNSHLHILPLSNETSSSCFG